MKFEIDTAELLSGTTLGLLFGLGAYKSSARSLILGREAFLEHYAQVFDRRMVNPPHLLPMLLVGVLLVLAAVLVFKIVTLAFKKILAAFPTAPKSGSFHQV